MRRISFYVLVLLNPPKNKDFQQKTQGFSTKKPSKLKQNLKRTQAQIPKKLKNRQLQLSWIAKKASKK